MPENEIYPSENQKKHFLSRAILAAVFVLSLGTLGYVWYFNPNLLAIKENLAKNKEINSSPNNANSLNGGVLVGLLIIAKA